MILQVSTLKMRYFFTLFFCLLIVNQTWAQKANYAAAVRYDVPNLKNKAGSISIVPFFFKNDDKFWFVFEDHTGKNYYWVDPLKGEKQLLFNKKVIVQKLTLLRKENIDTLALSFTAGYAIQPNQKTIAFSYKGRKYAYDFYNEDVKEAPKDKIDYASKPAVTGNLSLNQKWLLYTRKHNLYLKNNTDAVEIPLSTDAVSYYSFSLNEADSTYTNNQTSDAIWSANSSYFYVLRKDNRRVKTMSVVHTLSAPRPRIETYKYQLPGDQEVTQYELFIGNTDTKKMFKADIAKWPDQEITVVKTNNTLNEVFFLRKKRTCDEIELCTVDMLTGKVRTIIHEVSKPYINDDLFNVSILNNGKDILWWSDRTGWGHYYLYNSDGQLKKQVTSGKWTAGKILKTDTLSRTIYFYGYGKEPGRNPYFAHVYKIGFDGKGEKCLTPEDATHAVFFSPTGKYFIDTYSTINQVPAIILRNKNGDFVREIIRPDLKKLFDYGWRAPEPFKVKAKDGITDLYGIMWKPFDFDPNKKYPIISQVYPGPQTETVWPNFTIFDKYNNAPLAQLGFIVVCMGHRGGSPLRDKNYATYGYGNLRDAPLEDDKYGLEQLAQRYSYIDINRVGIFGHSGGGMMSTAAICTYPDFYKVAVSSSGNHDDNIYNRNWGETFEGIKEVKDTTKNGTVKTAFKFKTDVSQTLVKNLQGHLLLVTGEVDANVHPGNTYRVVDALVKANKDFDMLVLPGQSHHYDETYQPYFENKLRRYFAKYLIEDYPDTRQSEYKSDKKNH